MKDTRINQMKIAKSFDKLSILILILFIFFFSLRAIYPTADPPSELSWSAGLFFDGSSNSYNARNKALFGAWKVLDKGWSPMIYSPIFNYLEYLVFSKLGVGFAQQRIVPIFFSCLSLIFAYLLMKENYDRRHAALTVLFLGFNYTFIMYNRLAMFENQMIFFMILALFFWQRAVRMESNLYFFLSGVSCFLAYISKNICVYFILAAFFSLLFFVTIQSRKKLIKSYPVILSFIAGMGMVFFVWLIVFYIPNYSEISTIGSGWLKSALPDSFARLTNNIITQPLFRSLKQMPFIFIGASIFMLFFIFSIINKPEKVDSVDFFSFAWLILGAGLFAVLSYRRVRYYIPFVPPLSILAARGLIQLKDAAVINKELVKKYSFHCLLFFWSAITIFTLAMPYAYHMYSLNSDKQIPFIISLISGLLSASLCWFFLKNHKHEQIRLSKKLTTSLFSIVVIGFIVINGNNYLDWIKSPFFVLSEISKKLGKTLDNAIIVGKGSIAVSVENKHRPIEVPVYADDGKDIFKRYKVTHLFITSYAREAYKYKRNFPDIMKKASLLETYYIWNKKFYLFSLLENENPNFEKTFITYEAEFSPRRVGKVSFDKDASNFVAAFGSINQDKSGYLAYGPYNEIPSGNYLATFKLKIDKKETKQRVVAIDIAADAGNRVLNTREVYGKEFIENDVYQKFKMPFSIKKPTKLEFRVFFHKTVNLWVDNIQIYKGPAIK